MQQDRQAPRHLNRSRCSVLHLLVILVSACDATHDCEISTHPTPAHAPVTRSDEPSYFASQPIPTDPVRYPYNHAATIIETPAGDLLCAWGAGARELAPNTVILLSRRPLGSNEWTQPTIVADKPDYADANPVLFADDSGRIHLFHVEMFGDQFCLGRVIVRTSADDGHTWDAPHDALSTVCTMIRHHPIIFRDGRWLLPAYQQAIYASQFWISDDRGRTWQSGDVLVTPFDNNLQPAVVELSDGSLLSHMRSSGKKGETWEGRSTDGGKTWSLRKCPNLPNPNSGLELILLTDGTLLAIYNDSPTERSPLVAARSTDDGRTWSPPKVLAAGDPQLSYPSACRTRNGRIHVVFSHRLTHIEHVELNLSWLSNP